MAESPLHLQTWTKVGELSAEADPKSADTVLVTIAPR